MLTKNQDITLKIEGITAEGNGVGRFDGLAVFVPGSAVGDELLVHIVKVKKNYAFGKISEIIKPSEDRCEPDCDVSSRCGGCCFRHITYEAELRIKQQRVYDAFVRIGKIDPPMEDIKGSENVNSYRNKAQFPVGDAIGFYALGSHRIIPCTDCALQPPVFSDILRVVDSWMHRFNIPSYNELEKSGLVRHIYIRRGHYSREIMVCLVINGAEIPYSSELIADLTDEIPDFKTLVINENTEDTNVILGQKCTPLFGDGYINDTLCGLKFRISPLSFYQVNPPQAEALYTKAAEYASLEKTDVLLDLFCGTGTIGLTMANSVKKLVGAEIIQAAVSDADINAAANNIQNAEFICADAAEAALKLKEKGLAPDVITVDPPRKGLTPDLISTICEMNPKRVVYISCDPATLARDCALFTEQGFKVQKVAPFDMFPRTGHVETVCLMTRVGK